MQLEIDICHEIKCRLKMQRRSVRWLAAQINRDHSSLNKMLKGRSLNSDLLTIISDVLDVNLFQILADAFVKERKKQKKIQFTQTVEK